MRVEGEGEGAGEGEGEGEVPECEEDCEGFDGLQDQRRLRLSPTGDEEGGSSGRPRLGEPVEIALVAGGWLDGTVQGHWKLDGDAADSSGNGREGVVIALRGQAVPTDDRLGQPDRAILFEGPMAGITVADASKFTSGRALTACAWAKPRSWSIAGSHVVGMGVGPAMGGELAMSLGFTRQGLPEFFHSIDARETRITHEELHENNEWRHMCAVLDGRTAWLYMDGAPVASSPMPRPIRPAVGDLHIGTCRFPVGQCPHTFEGVIDDVVVLSRALSPLELRSLADSRADFGAVLTSNQWPRSGVGAHFNSARSDFADVGVAVAGGPADFEVIGARPLASDPSGLDEAVVAYLPFDDGDTNERVFGSETQLVAPARLVGDRFGQADSGVSIAADGPLVGPLGLRLGSDDSFTVEVWARFLSGAGTFLALRHRGQPPVRISCSQDGAPSVRTFTQHDGQGTRVFQGPGNVCQDAAWHHYGFVYDAAAGAAALYFDGVPVSGQQFGGIEFEDGDLLLGAGDLTPDAGVHVDEVVIHDVARSADTLYKRAHPLPRVRFLADAVVEEGRNRYRYEDYTLWWRGAPVRMWYALALLSRTRGWVGWWTFDERTDRVAVDRSANRHHGLLEGPRLGMRVPHAGGLALDGGLGNPRSMTVHLPQDAIDPELGLTVEMHLDRGGAGPVMLQVPYEGQRLAVREARPGLIGCEFPLLAEVSPIAEIPEAPGTWRHVGCRLDDESASIWVNGVPELELAHEVPLGFPAPTGPLTAGTDVVGGAVYGGRLDGIRIMSIALQPAETLFGSPTRVTAEGEMGENPN